jgi:chemotaxis protein methyltransferase CheR
MLRMPVSNESYFLRHSEQYPLLLNEVSTCVDKGGVYSIWSCGCSRGEEPYSIAILVQDQLGYSGIEHTTILASDMDPQVINIAKSGHYRAWSFRGVSQDFINRYFTKCSGDDFCLQEAVRKSVLFEVGVFPQRLEEYASSSVDLILFRNVAIYLNKETISSIYRNFNRILKPDGILLVAPCDPKPSPELFSRFSNVCGVFRANRIHKLVATYAPVVPAPPRPKPAPKVKVPDPTVTEIKPKEEVEGVAILRKLLYFSPGNLIVRFKYAVALLHEGEAKTAKAQACIILRELDKLNDGTVLTDGVTTAKGLRDIVSFMKTGLR